MNKEFKNKLILTVIDKLLFGFLVGIVILVGQFYVTKTIEKEKSVLSYQTVIAQARAENIQTLWYATYKYGRTLAGVLRSDNPESRFDDLLEDAQAFEKTLG